MKFAILPYRAAQVPSIAALLGTFSSALQAPLFLQRHLSIVKASIKHQSAAGGCATYRIEFGRTVRLYLSPCNDLQQQVFASLQH